MFFLYLNHLSSSRLLSSWTDQFVILKKLVDEILLLSGFQVKFLYCLIFRTYHRALPVALQWYNLTIHYCSAIPLPYFLCRMVSTYSIYLVGYISLWVLTHHEVVLPGYVALSLFVNFRSVQMLVRAAWCVIHCTLSSQVLTLFLSLFLFISLR